MRILHLTNLIGFGGVESYVKALACAQSRMGHQVGILVCLNSTHGQTDSLLMLESAGVLVTCIDAANGHDIRLLLKLPSAIRRFKPDIIHLSSTPLFASVTLGFSRVPKVLTLHLIDDNTLKEKITHFFYRASGKGVIAVSDAVLDFHRNFCARYFRSNWVRIYNGIHLERFQGAREKHLPAVGEKRILTMTCRMESDKHVDDAIRALALLQREGFQGGFRLMLIGDGSAIPALQQLAADLGVAGVVDFLGYQPDVLPFLQMAHCHLVLSETETFSIAALEAMACNVPVVSYRVAGGFHELHRHGISGVVTTSRTPEDLAASIRDIFMDNELWSDYSRNAARVAGEFSLEKMTSETVKFYESILSNRNVIETT